MDAARVQYFPRENSDDIDAKLCDIIINSMAEDDWGKL